MISKLIFIFSVLIVQKVFVQLVLSLCCSYQSVTVILRRVSSFGSNCDTADRSSKGARAGRPRIQRKRSFLLTYERHKGLFKLQTAEWDWKVETDSKKSHEAFKLLRVDFKLHKENSRFKYFKQVWLQFPVINNVVYKACSTYWPANVGRVIMLIISNFVRV